MSSYTTNRVKIPELRKWIARRNATLLEPQADNEVVRFATSKGNGVVLLGKSGKLECNEVAQKALRCFVERQTWSGGLVPAPPQQPTQRTKRTGAQHKMVVERLAERDGSMSCAYCGCHLTSDTATIEHVVPLAKAGSDSMDNMILACFECNQNMGNASVYEKIQKLVSQKLEITSMEKYGINYEELTGVARGADDIKSNLDVYSALSELPDATESQNVKHVLDVSGAIEDDTAKEVTARPVAKA